mmetsp:Transcript_48079/g.61618  ORF Transcript_48079/g.61618 Transcript_48079/m.61618 type:complete len:529 (+) Transcript_48079:3-1589(+)
MRRGNVCMSEEETSLLLLRHKEEGYTMASESFLSDPYMYEEDEEEEKQSEEKKTKEMTPRSGYLSTVSNITKCFIGAASFELPHAFEQAGVIGSIVGILFLAITSSYSLQLLASCIHLLPKRVNGQPITYPSLGSEAYGYYGWLISWFGVLAMTLGVCGSYFVFIASTMSSITSINQTYWLLITLTIVTILSWLRYLSYLAFTSAFGIIALVLAVIVTCIDASEYHNGTHQNITELPLFEVKTYPLFLGNAGFLYLISTAVLPLAQNMDITSENKYDYLTEPSIHGGMIRQHGQNKKGKTFNQAFNISVLFVTILNLTFGLYTWKQYGECHGDDDDTCIQSNVIDNLGNGKLSKIVKILLCIDLLFTSLVFLFPVNELIEQELLGTNIISKLTLEANSTPSSSSSSSRTSRTSTSIKPFGNLLNIIEWKRNGLRTCLVIAVALIAFAVPSFSLLTGLTGGFGNNILGFILPPLFYYQLQSKARYWHDVNGKRIKYFEQFILLFIFLFGIAFLFLSTYSFITEIVKTDE